LDAKKNDLVPWTEKINQKKSEINIAEGQLELLREKTTAGERETEELDKQTTECKASLAEKKTLLAETIKTFSRLQKTVQELQEKSNVLRIQESKMRQLVVEASQQYESGKASLQAASSRDELIKRLLAERDSGRIPGIFVCSIFSTFR
jgi:structural maintenance of chromosome 4